MKILSTATVLLFSLSSVLFAGIEKQEDGTFIISGPITYMAERNNIFLGSGFDKGEYKNVLLKEPILAAAPELKNCKKTEVSLKVQAREAAGADGVKTLIAEKLVEVIKGPEASTAP